MSTFTKNDKPFFTLGRIIVTGKATEVPKKRLGELLYEHRRGHWGFVEPGVAVLNARSLAHETEFVTSLHRVAENGDKYLILATNLDEHYTLVRRYDDTPEDVQKRLLIGKQEFVAFVPEGEGYLH